MSILGAWLAVGLIFAGGFGCGYAARAYVSHRRRLRAAGWGRVRFIR